MLSVVALFFSCALFVLFAELIRHINDPEHPLTLEQLRVAQLEQVVVHDALGSADAHAASTIDIRFTPTIPHCQSQSHTRTPLALQAHLARV
jgi:hypothetical protein